MDLDEAKSWQLPDECLPTGDITTLLRAKEEAKFEELVGMSQGLLHVLESAMFLLQLFARSLLHLNFSRS